MSISLKDELKDDLSFNETNLSDKMSNLPGIIGKWTDRYIKCKHQLNKLEIEKSSKVKGRTNYYSGRKKNPEGKYCPVELSPQEIRDVYVPGDKDILELKEQIDKKKLELYFYDSALKQCNQIQWIMKNYIDWNKYINGAI